MANSKGSSWFRWEPHIHCPGTILNDQFSGADPLEDFVQSVENSSPLIRALGITDYYSVVTYEKILEVKKAGRLSNIEFLFPNIELRFNTGTSAGSAINGHLLISPDDHNHISEAKRFLTNLTFSVGTETYRCNKEDLIRLGYFHDKTITSDEKALLIGTNQFKVEHTELIESYNKSDWAKKNIIIAVSANSNDGTSGLQKDASFSALRKKIERTAHIMMTSHESQRLFWVGRGILSKAKIIEEYYNLKPCIHGSDAHENDKVGKPDLNRYTWIKGDLTFESLRQICIEPEERVFIGESPVNEKIASTVIDNVEILNAGWLKNPILDLNPGLIAIIGARGSGKTALADLIALGGYAISAQLNSRTSFIERAKDYISAVSTSLSWKSGEKTSNSISMIGLEDLLDYSRVQYLSQQFVDTLCSSEGITDELMQEIERVIFTAHSENSRIGISGFREMLNVRSANARRERQNYEQQIRETSEAITQERGKKNSLASLNKKLEEKAKIIATDKNIQKALIITGANEKISSLEKVSSALTVVSAKIDRHQKQQQSIKALQQAVVMARASTFPNYLTKLKSEYKETALDETKWEIFNVNFAGDVDTLLSLEETKVSKTISKLMGSGTINPAYTADSSFIDIAQELNEHTYYNLHHETERLKTVIGLDTQKGKQYAQLNSKIVKEEQELEKLKEDISDATGADERIKKLISNRRDAYQKVFIAIIEEENILKELYKPLEDNLKSQKGSLSKLAFHVKRFIDIDSWTAEGESLLDLRKGGALRGRGSLAAASQELKLSWETETAQEIADAMAKFRSEQEGNLVEHSPFVRSDPAFNKWANKVAEWLYSTKHVTLSYGIQYDSVEIGQLSPGTRGIVLLLLYLAIDKEDIRPLIIDQPEENLDPKSIFDELVPLFRLVKLRRQIIIVTHNANLVVNTDADQVIIAECGQHIPGGLPDIHYLSGGLENPAIRTHVCSILEGGEAAFKERAKRLRVTL